MPSWQTVTHVTLALSMLCLPELHAEKCGFDFTINVFTYNRPDGLKRLWKSLLETDYMGVQVDLVLFQDYDRAQELNYTASELNRFISTEATWPHGKFQVFKKLKRDGLVSSIMSAWWPTSENSLAAFFEDDLEVSPFWFRWVYQALHKYYFVPDRHPKLIGFSLYRPTTDELTTQRVSPKNGYQPFAYQQPCSWGQVMFPGPWRYFRQWKGKMYRAPNINNPKMMWVNSDLWQDSTSWKKYLIYLMYHWGLFMIYPNFPQRYVLSTNHFMKGEHPSPGYETYHLPLLTPGIWQSWERASVRVGRKFDPFAMPPLRQLRVLNTTAQIARSIDDLHGASTRFAIPRFAPGRRYPCEDREAAARPSARERPATRDVGP